MTEMEPGFRRLTIKDLNEVLLLEKLSFSHPWSRASYTYELSENELGNYYGFFDGNKLIAFGGYWLIVDEGHIANVAVHPAYRRQGWGELLMRRLIPFCLAQGGNKMTLEVRKQNLAAYNLYIKLGFAPAGIRPGYYDNPKDDAIIMWLDLDTCQIRNKGLITDNDTDIGD